MPGDHIDAWGDGIERLHAEAGGVLDVTIIDAALGIELLAATILGDRRAAALLQAVVHSGAQVGQAPKHSPALCVCCPRPVRWINSATIFGVVVASTAAPTQAVGFVFCDHCGADRGSLAAKVTEALKGVWPDLRPIVITDPAGGHA
jgi:hypothetical protein